MRKVEDFQARIKMFGGRDGTGELYYDVTYSDVLSSAKQLWKVNQNGNLSGHQLTCIGNVAHALAGWNQGAKHAKYGSRLLQAVNASVPLCGFRPHFLFLLSCGPR